MNIWQSINGMLTAELTSADLENTLARISDSGIEIRRLQQMSELTCRFSVSRKQLNSLKRICQKRGDNLKVIQRQGIFWHVKAFGKRPVLLLGFCFWLCMLLYLPTRVLFVRVEGNRQVPAERIRNAAETIGIRFGASRRDVRSERVKNALLSEVPQLQWVGVNTSGCLATISVRERSASEQQIEQAGFSNIVASRDGYIISGNVTQGSGVFQIGEAVREGQILISGYTDCGLCIQATRAQGEIIAHTKREISAVTPAGCIVIRDKAAGKKKISLIIRKKRINLWKDSGISDTTCGRMYEEYYITLPGGFRLPMALCVEIYPEYVTEPALGSLADAETLLFRFADRYLLDQMIAGELLQKTLRVTQRDDKFTLEGYAVCREMIGREQAGQIGDTNE